MTITAFVVHDGATAAGRTAWLAAWTAWPEREVFAHPDYVALWAQQPGWRPMLACAHLDDVTVLHPFVFRDLRVEPLWDGTRGPAADLVSAYGYGGPFAWGPGSWETAASGFWTAFDSWARDVGVVAEFVRRLPIPEALLPFPGELEVASVNVVRSLTPSLDEIWRDYEHKVRKNVARAERSGVSITEDETGTGLDAFLDLYHGTMKRVAAADRYWLQRPFFERLHRALPGQFLYVHAWLEERPVSTELVLVSARRTYSFLGGTRADAFGVRPNDLIKHHIIVWSKALGCDRFVLGGGYAPDDGIFRYKRSFAPRGLVNFYVGRRVLRPDLYVALSARAQRYRAASGLAAPPANFFPAYRDV